VETCGNHAAPQAAPPICFAALHIPPHSLARAGQLEMGMVDIKEASRASQNCGLNMMVKGDYGL
jgi:hypothetical protein